MSRIQALSPSFLSQNLPTHGDLTASDSLGEEEFDAYDVEYHYSQFVAALGIHAVHFFGGPLSIPLIWLLFGRTLASNMGFFMFPFYIVEFVSYMIMLLIELLYILYPDRTDDFRFVVIATMTVLLIRLGMVCLKYGNVTKKWWKRLKTEFIPPKELLNKLILAAWLKVPEDVAESELKNAFGRLPLCTSELFLVFKENLGEEVREKLWDMRKKGMESFVCPVDVEQERLESAYFIARMLVSGAISQHDTFSKWFSVFAGLGYAICPHVLRLYLFGPSSYQLDAIECIFTPLSFIYNWFFGFALLTFIIVGIVDFQRKRWLMSQCSGLISDYDRILVMENLPRIDLSDVRSIHGWYYTRRAFLDFGRRFSNRIHLYASVIVPILLIAVVFILLQMLGVLSRAYNWELICPLYLSIAFDVVIVRMILEAVKLNESFEIHSDLLLEASSRVRASEKGALDALQWTVRKLEVDRELRPVTILGFTINQDLINKLLALGLSGVLALLRLLIT